MAAYISAIPLISYVILLHFKSFNFPKLLAKGYVVFFILIFSIISVANLNLYREWGSKINFRALDLAFNSPKEAITSISSSPIVLSLFVILVMTLGLTFLSSKIISYKITDRTKPLWQKLSASFCFLVILFLAIRGGWQLSPVNQSMSYFSSETVLNHAAVNTEWNLLHDIINNKFGNENPYQYYSKEKAEEIASSLFKKPNSETTKILNSDRPNVVFIILESFTAQFVEELGGEKGVTPNFNKLSREGLLFEQIYAASNRTDKGVVATLSGFPAQAIRSIMKQNSKQEKLPAISQELEKNEYATSFYYGGESEFFNMKSYILSHGYQNMVDQHSFEPKDMNSKWGAYDEKVFEKNLTDLDQVSQPFFSTILTLTNHEPFELPVASHFRGEDIDNKFRSTAFYTDSCLGAYLNEAKKKTWYKNTLFVIIADHSHRIPGNLTEYDPKRYHIPLLFIGDVIKPEFRGTKINKIGNQTDLVATVLNQLSIKPDRYKWSKDLLNPGTAEFAFFNWDNGFGFVRPDQSISFDNIGKSIILRKNSGKPKTDIELANYGKAYMQEVYRQYLDY